VNWQAVNDVQVNHTGVVIMSPNAAAADIAAFAARAQDEPLPLFWSQADRDHAFEDRLLATA
jgi:hypothetical protein